MRTLASLTKADDCLLNVRLVHLLEELPNPVVVLLRVQDQEANPASSDERRDKPFVELVDYLGLPTLLPSNRALSAYFQVHMVIL